MEKIESASTEVSVKDGELFDGFDLGLWIAFPFVVFLHFCSSIRNMNAVHLAVDWDRNGI